MCVNNNKIMGGNNMLREQRIMNRMAEELNGELDEYIMTFNGCDFWRIKEGEVIVNKTFKRILNIMADFNLTTTEDILDDVYKLPDTPDVMLSMLPKLAYMYGENGGESILNRSMVLCYLLHYIVTVEDDLTATDVLKDVQGIGTMFLTQRDVVRHELVQRIIIAYEKYDNKKEHNKLEKK